MNKEDREWLDQLIRENKESDNELTYTYCPFSVLYALQQENQQLKFQLEYEKENLMFSKDYAKCLEEKRDKYKSVLDEIREKIDYYIHYSTSDSSYMSYQQYKEILQILDKVKEGENNG